jgi:hypothetical protein
MARPPSPRYVGVEATSSGRYPAPLREQPCAAVPDGALPTLQSVQEGGVERVELEGVGIARRGPGQMQRRALLAVEVERDAEPLPRVRSQKPGLVVLLDDDVGERSERDDRDTGIGARGHADHRDERAGEGDHQPSQGQVQRIGIGERMCGIQDLPTAESVVDPAHELLKRLAPRVEPVGLERLLLAGVEELGAQVGRAGPILNGHALTLGTAARGVQPPHRGCTEARPS